MARALGVAAMLAGAALAALVAEPLGTRGALAMGAGLVVLGIPLCMDRSLARRHHANFKHYLKSGILDPSGGRSIVCAL